jgi:PEP-CTERM motif.
VTATPLSRLLRHAAFAAAVSACLLPAAAANAQSLWSNVTVSTKADYWNDSQSDASLASVDYSQDENVGTGAAQTNYGVNKARFSLDAQSINRMSATVVSEWGDWFTITEGGTSGLGTMKLAFDFDGTFSGYPSQATFTAYVYSQSGAGGESFEFDLTTLGSSGRFETDDITFAFGEATFVLGTLRLESAVDEKQSSMADFFNTVSLSAITTVGAPDAVLETASGSSYYNSVFNVAPAAAAVPEPGTFALAGLGVLALAARSAATRRRQRNASPAA